RINYVGEKKDEAGEEGKSHGKKKKTSPEETNQDGNQENKKYAKILLKTITNEEKVTSPALRQYHNKDHKRQICL
ncbi:hypothetical protein CHS0354_020173, partial [Potamilus streckersoni]